MSYHLGVDLGTTYTAAAVSRGGQLRIVTLDDRASVVPSVVYLRDDGELLVGRPAERRGLANPDRLARQFKRRIGDATPMLLGGSPWSPQALTAELLRWVVDHVSAREGGPPDRLALSHPANWGAFKIDLLAQAVDLAGFSEATLVSEPEAAALHWASEERVDVGTTTIVYDLGGGTFDVAILQKTETGFRFLGRPSGIEHLGGLDFDAAVLDHVQRLHGDALAQLDVDDPAIQAAAARVRDDCTAAKEALSSDTSAVVPLLFPNLSDEVRITRREFEAMIRPPLAQTLEVASRALDTAGLTPGDIDTVLLVGGSSRVPLVAQMVGAEFGRPVAVDTHPKHAIALGAARVLDLLPAELSLAGTPEVIAAQLGGDSEAQAATAGSTPLTVSEAAVMTMVRTHHDTPPDIDFGDSADPGPHDRPPDPSIIDLRDRPEPFQGDILPAGTGSLPVPAGSVAVEPSGAGPQLVGAPTRRPQRRGLWAVAAALLLVVGAVAGWRLLQGNTTDPELVWQFETNSALAAKPALGSDTLVVGAAVTERVHALDIATGEERWSFATTGGVVGDPAIADGRVFAGSQDGSFYAIDLETGSEVWQVDTGAAITGGAFVADGVVYVGDQAGVLHAFDATTGEKRWGSATGGEINTTPAPANRGGAEVLVVGSTDGGLYLLDPDTGTQLERVQLEGGVWYSSPLIVDRPDGQGGQEVWIGTSLQDSGLLNRVELDSLEVRTFTNRAGVGTDPAITNDALIVAGNDIGELFAVSQRSLGEAWREGFADNTNIKGSPVVVDDVVIFGTHGNELIAVADDTGEELWSFRGEQIFGLSAPIEADNRLYVGNDSGTVYAFDL